MSKEVWLVHFETGEYEDHSEAIDRVFDNEIKARAYVDQKTALLEKWGMNGNHGGSNIANYEMRKSPAMLEEFGYSIDYTGAWYSVSGPYTVE